MPLLQRSPSVRVPEAALGRFGGGARLCGGALRLELGRAAPDGRRACGVHTRQRGQQLVRAAREIVERGDTALQQHLGLAVAAAGHHRHRLREPARELAHLRLAVDVELPAGELDREAHVLALAPDRERELVVRRRSPPSPSSASSMMTFETSAGRQRAADEARRVWAPRHDVDLLAAQLLHDGLHAAALHADARADRDRRRRRARPRRSSSAPPGSRAADSIVTMPS